MDSTIFNLKNCKTAKNTSPCTRYIGCGRPKPLPIDLIFYQSDPNMQRQLFPAIKSGKKSFDGPPYCPLCPESQPTII